MSVLLVLVGERAGRYSDDLGLEADGMPLTQVRYRPFFSTVCRDRIRRETNRVR